MSNVSFVDQLNEFSFVLSHVLVSYDVESLFTNIPSLEALLNVCKYIYQPNDPPEYPIEIFRKLLKITTV